MTAESEADREIREIASTLEALKARLGDAYWRAAEADDLRADLRRRIGAYGSWAPDKPPIHRRTRTAARYESQFAHLLWPR